MNNQALVFTNNNFCAIRALVINDQPWFVGCDVTVALGYANSSKAIADHLKTKHRMDEVTIRDPIGRMQKTTVISEAGLYRLVMRSKKNEAESFQDWVTDEVLPSIRKTGSYTVTPAPKPELKITAQAYFFIKSIDFLAAIKYTVFSGRRKVR